MNRLPENIYNHDKIIVKQCYNKLQSSRIVSIYRPFIDIIGNFDAAVFLSQLIYWNRKGVDLVDNNSFIYKTIEEIQKETGLTKVEQRISKDILKTDDLNLIEIYRQSSWGKGSKTFIKLNNEIILHKLCEYYDINIEEVGEITPENWKIGNHPVLRRLFSDRIAYHRDLVYCTGNIQAATMLSYLLNRCAVEQKIYKSYTIEDWSRILRFSKSTQSSVRLLLKELGVLEEKRLISFNARLSSFPQFDAILEKLERLEEYKENPVAVKITKLSKKSKNNGQNDGKNNNPLENNKLVPKCKILKHGSAQVQNPETQKCKILKHSINEITLRDYSTYTTPLNPPPQFRFHSEVVAVVCLRILRFRQKAMSAA